MDDPIKPGKLHMLWRIMLIGAIALFILGLLTPGSGVFNSARTSITRQRAEMLVPALYAYRQNNREYPPSFANKDLIKELVEEKLILLANTHPNAAGEMRDGWQNPMRFSIKTNPIKGNDLIAQSSGPDGIWDTPDDLTFTFPLSAGVAP